MVIEEERKPAGEMIFNHSFIVSDHVVGRVAGISQGAGRDGVDGHLKDRTEPIVE